MSDLKKHVLIFPMVIFFSLVFALSFSEYWSIAIVSDPNTIESYHFGSEPMVAHGGAKYRSAEAYARSSLIFTVMSLLGIVLPWFILRRFKSNQVLMSFCTGLLLLMLMFMAG
ncbi:hypothetical protein [Marinicella meishanensis]|uniref:hypothetical protein n=1 Tax=Marinicella meishanensis TaxID=2873263 RepID=UPI001CBB75F1|nr:hypothetical protein [Marinicella sp. NBU2979]